MADSKEKLSTEGSGFPGIKSGTENNARGTTKVEVGEPGGNFGKVSRDSHGELIRSSGRYPLRDANPTKDNRPFEKGETRNTYHPKNGR